MVVKYSILNIQKTVELKFVFYAVLLARHTSVLIHSNTSITLSLGKKYKTNMSFYVSENNENLILVLSAWYAVANK